MTNNENTWDKLLQIKTTGRDDSNSDQYRLTFIPLVVVVAKLCILR